MNLTVIYDEITSHLEKVLSPKRFHHTMGGVTFALEMCELHNIPRDKVLMATLLHDCAKGYTLEQNNDLIQLAAPYMQAEDECYPALLHGFIGAVEANRLFNVNDPELLKAIAYHPTGCKNPSPVLCALIAADFCEPTRDFPGLEEAREIVRQDLRNGVVHILKSKTNHLLEKGKTPHSRVYETIKSLEG